jgi:hypothetical protein
MPPVDLHAASASCCIIRWSIYYTAVGGDIHAVVGACWVPGGDQHVAAPDIHYSCYSASLF